MKLDKEKTLIAQAKAKKTTAEVCSSAVITSAMYRRAYEKGCRPATAGKIAEALGVPVTDIIEEV